MDKDWILAFDFFMLFNNSPEVMTLLNSDNFDEDFKNTLKELEAADPEDVIILWLLGFILGFIIRGLFKSR